MIELKEGKPQRIILQLTNQGEPYDGEASFRVVYNYKKKDEKVVFDKTSDVVDGKLTLDFPSFKDNDYIYLIETEEGHTEPDEFHIFRSLLNKEPKESQLNIELDQDFGLNKDVLGEKAQEFFDKNAGRLKQTEKLLEERKREREDGEKNILKALEETKKEHLSQMGEFHLNIQEQIVDLSDEIEEEELERQKGDDAVTNLVKVEVGSLDSKINSLETAYISADKSLEKRLNVKTDKLSSDITNVSKKLEGKIPTGGILDFTVDDEKVAKNILWSSVKITDVLRGLRTNNQGFHYTTDINDSQSSAETTYSSEYIDANFGGSGGAWGSITGTLSDQTDLQTALDAKVDENVAITGATKTKITYDAKGLVTAGADATTADIADSSNKRYVTDANLTVIGNTSGTNTGDQTTIVGITGTKAEFDTAVTDGNIVFTDAIGVSVQGYSADLTDLINSWTPASASGSSSLDFYEDTDNGTNKITLQGTANIGGDVVVTIPGGTTTLVGYDLSQSLTNKSIDFASNTITTTIAQLNTAISDANLIPEAGGTFTGDISVPDEAYGAGWNGSVEVPTKNALYDKIETLGGGSGITRTVVVTSGSITLGTTASVDYLYFVAGAHTLSMPSPNTNRYTVKNNHSANITIDTAGAETIEGAASISIAPEEAVDIASDGTNRFII